MAEEKKEIKIEELTAMERMSYVRVEVQRRAKKKSGRGINGSAYYQQEDFLPIANEVFCKYKLLPMFIITGRYEGDKWVEVASLTIHDVYGKYDSLVFTTPTANVNMANQMQGLGAKHSYLKRYMYLDALELTEYDMVEQKAVVEQKANPYATSQRQVDELKKYYSESEIAAICKSYKVNNPLNLDVTVVEMYITQGRKRSNAN